MAAPVVGVTLQGLTFSHTATTFLEGYEVTSGGDWSIHRDAGEAPLVPFRPGWGGCAGAGAGAVQVPAGAHYT
jgi:hypothetical protein